jgi:integrase
MRKMVEWKAIYHLSKELCMRKYYLHTRHGGIYYAEIVSPTGRKLMARSTGTRDRDEAILRVSEWLQNGIPSGRKRSKRPAQTVMALDGILSAIRQTKLSADDYMKILDAVKAKGIVTIAGSRIEYSDIRLVSFLADFWNRDKSQYIKDKLSHGYSVGLLYCSNMQSAVRDHWKAFFGECTITSLTSQDLSNFSTYLSRDKNFSTATVRRILQAGKVAYTWAVRNKVIASNPFDGTLRFIGKEKKREVLTIRKAEKLFSVQWDDERAYAANLLAITTGLRQGEILALRKHDIINAEGILYIEHSWNYLDRLKSTKTETPRNVILLSEVKELLLNLLEKNPHKVENPYVFYHDAKDDAPVRHHVLTFGLKNAMKAAGVGEGKNIVFHSHRHFYASRMVDKMTPDEISRITGHKSKAVFRIYSEHVEKQNIEKVTEVEREVFSGIITPKTAG